MTQLSKPLMLQIEANIHPQAPMASSVSAVVTAVESLRISGVGVHRIHVETRGTGQGYLQALQDAPELIGCVVLPLKQVA
jgi:hypothetical protein